MKFVFRVYLPRYSPTTTEKFSPLLSSHDSAAQTIHFACILYMTSSMILMSVATYPGSTELTVHKGINFTQVFASSAAGCIVSAFNAIFEML